MRPLSKSKLIAFKQCQKRMWLAVKKPSLKDESGSEADFRRGHEVGELARRVFDPDSSGTLIDFNEIGWARAFEETTRLLKSGKGPVFEAALKVEGAMAFADLMLPDWSNGKLHWRLIEVKSSTRVKEYHRDDLAVQVCIALELGIPISQAGVACINTSFVYSGDANYSGLFTIEDLTQETLERQSEVRDWIANAQIVSSEKSEPVIDIGPQCSSPFACEFWGYCSQDLFQPDFHFSILPRLTSKKTESWEEIGIVELRDTPDGELNPIQLRVKRATLSGEPFFDAQEAAKALSFPEVKLAYFLDFETVSMAIPIWTGTRPYEKLPFQFSCHCVQQNGEIIHEDFLDISGEDPRSQLIEELISACGKEGPIYVYNAQFEKSVIIALAKYDSDRAQELEALLPRIVDLLPIARNHYYHPVQEGSWSLKAIIPAICPELDYEELDGIQDGRTASEAYAEAIKQKTSGDRRVEIENQLLKYCELDTFATVKIWDYFRGK